MSTKASIASAIEPPRSLTGIDCRRSGHRSILNQQAPIAKHPCPYFHNPCVDLYVDKISLALAKFEAGNHSFALES